MTQRIPEPSAGPLLSESRLSRVAIALLGAQVGVITGFVVFFLVEFAQGQAQEPAAVLTSVLMFVMGIIGLSLLLRGWLARRSWVRTPTLVWHALLLPIGWSLVQTHHGVIAAAVLGAGLLGIAVAWYAGAESRNTPQQAAPETDPGPGSPGPESH